MVVRAKKKKKKEEKVVFFFREEKGIWKKRTHQDSNANARVDVCKVSRDGIFGSVEQRHREGAYQDSHVEVRDPRWNRTVSIHYRDEATRQSVRGTKKI